LGICDFVFQALIAIGRQQQHACRHKKVRKSHEALGKRLFTQLLPLISIPIEFASITVCQLAAAAAAAAPSSSTAALISKECNDVKHFISIN